ncbi:MAG: hypothetical protein Q8O00_09500 [Holophaga sp.]|nr:hypothetical protein [Holophaga sp.]
MSIDIATLSLAVDSSGVKNATRDMDAMASVGKGLEGIVTKLAAAFGLFKMAEFVKDSATLAARYETLGIVMQVAGNNAGYTGAQMQAFEQALQKTGISMVSSRDALTSMATANLDLAKSSALARAAQDVAVVGNINSSEAFRNMVRGIQTGEVEILKTMRLNVQFEAGYKSLGAELRKNATDLTAQEKLQSRLNQVLQESAKYTGIYEASMSTAGKQLLSMQRYSEDLQEIFGALFSDAFGVVVQSLNQALQDTKKWLTENAIAAETMRYNLGSAATNFVGLVKDVIGVASNMSKVNDEFSIGEVLTGYIAGGMALVRDAVMAVVGVVQTLWGAIATIISGVIYGFTKLVGMVASFQPPDWMKTFYESSKGIFNDGGKNLQGGAITKFIDGGDWQAQFNALEAKKAADKKAEDARIAAGNGTRAAEAAKAAADAKAAAGAAAYAAAMKYKIDVMKWEADAYDKGAAAASKHADAGVKDKLALQDFVTSLQPAIVEAEKMQQVQHDLGWALAYDIINQEKYNELLGLAKTKFTQAGQAAEAYAQRLDDSVERQNASVDFNGMRAEIELERARGLNLDLYKLKLQDVHAAELRFRAESGQTWAIIGDTVMQNANSASDAMVNWMNNTDGVGRSWKTLGDTVKKVVADMLIEMQKVIIRQQMMQWLQMGVNAFAPSAAQTTGSVAGGYIAGQTNTLLNVPPPAYSGSAAMNSFSAPSASSGKAGGVSAPVYVTVNNTGSSTSTEGGQNMKKLGDMIGSKVREVMVTESRPGGLLNQV